MKLDNCKYCGHVTPDKGKIPDTNQRYAQVVCEKCGARGPFAKNESEAWKGWNTKGNFIISKPDPSKCIDCGWNGDNSEIKDLRLNDKTMHWTCPQCNNKRVTLGEPVNKVWSGRYEIK